MSKIKTLVFGAALTAPFWLPALAEAAPCPYGKG